MRTVVERTAGIARHLTALLILGAFLPLTRLHAQPTESLLAQSLQHVRSAAGQIPGDSRALESMLGGAGGTIREMRGGGRWIVEFPKTTFSNPDLNARLGK